MPLNTVKLFVRTEVSICNELFPIYTWLSCLLFNHTLQPVTYYLIIQILRVLIYGCPVVHGNLIITRYVRMGLSVFIKMNEYIQINQLNTILYRDDQTIKRFKHTWKNITSFHLISIITALKVQKKHSVSRELGCYLYGNPGQLGWT